MNRIFGKATAPSLLEVLTELAPLYFAEFGDAEIGRNDIGYAEDYKIRTTHCDVHFYRHQGDLGSYVKPHENPRCVLQYGGEVRYRSDGLYLRDEIEKQMREIVEKFRAALEGDLRDWPTK